MEEVQRAHVPFFCRDPPAKQKCCQKFSLHLQGWLDPMRHYQHHYDLQPALQWAKRAAICLSVYLTKWRHQSKNTDWLNEKTIRKVGWKICKKIRLKVNNFRKSTSASSGQPCPARSNFSKYTMQRAGRRHWHCGTLTSHKRQISSKSTAQQHPN